MVLVETLDVAGCCRCEDHGQDQEDDVGDEMDEEEDGENVPFIVVEAGAVVVVDEVDIGEDGGDGEAGDDNPEGTDEPLDVEADTGELGEAETEHGELKGVGETGEPEAEKSKSEYGRESLEKG